MQRYAKYPNLYSYYSLHHHYIVITSHHMSSDPIIIVIVFHSAFITGTTGTTGTTALRVLDGLADLLLGLGHHGLEASPHGVLGVGVFAHRCVPRSMARPRSKTQNMSLPQRSNRFLQIPTDPTGFDQIWIWDTWEMRNNWFCHEFQHEFVRFFAEQPGLICTRLGPFTAALPLLCTDQEHAAATAKPTWAVKVDRSPRWELGRAASPAGTGATGAALLTVLTVPTGEAIRAGTSIFVNLLPPFVVQWLRNMQTQNTCHHDLRHVMNCHEAPSASASTSIAFLALPCSALLCTSARFLCLTVLVDEESVASEGLTASEIFAIHFGEPTNSKAKNCSGSVQNFTTPNRNSTTSNPVSDLPKISFQGYDHHNIYIKWNVTIIYVHLSWINIWMTGYTGYTAKLKSFTGL